MTTRRFVLLTGLLYTALTAVMTFPQVLHLRGAVHDDGDPLLVTWILGWVAHQLPLAPAHLFDANIFYPERHTLAFAETLLAPAVAVAPLQWIGVNGILIYNLVLLAGFVLSGIATAVLVRRLTDDASAATIAGLVFALLPYRLDQYAHLQLQQTQWIPLALLAWHSLLRTGRVRDGAWLGLCLAGQTLSCVYYGLFLAPYLAAVGGMLLAIQGGFSRRRLAALACGAVVAGVAMAPVARAYVAAREHVGERPYQEVIDNSATWRSYLTAPVGNVVYGTATTSNRKPEEALFPGLVAVLLAAIAVWPRRRDDAKTRYAYLIGLIVAFDLSLGVHGLTYPILYRYVFPFRALRAPARMGMFVGFSLAVLAGYGVARINRWFASPARARVAVLAMAVLILLEYASRPIALQPIPPGVPEVYADLLRDRGDGPDAPVVEYPLGEHNEPTYMYYSTFHWQPLANGYSGFFPASYLELQFAFESFPGDAPIGMLKARGIRYLVVHGERMIGERYARIIPELDARTDLKLVSRRPAERAGQHGEASLYRVLF